MTKTERTVAKIGRSTKKCDMFIAVAGSMSSRRLDLSGLRRDLAAGPRPHEPVDDNPVARLKTRADDAKAILSHGPWTHDFRLDSAVVFHGHHHLARLIGDDGAVGYQD